jgi:hypothetical protein
MDTVATIRQIREHFGFVLRREKVQDMLDLLDLLGQNANSLVSLQAQKESLEGSIVRLKAESVQVSDECKARMDTARAEYRAVVDGYAETLRQKAAELTTAESNIAKAVASQGEAIKKATGALLAERRTQIAQLDKEIEQKTALRESVKDDIAALQRKYA